MPVRIGFFDKRFIFSIEDFVISRSAVLFRCICASVLQTHGINCCCGTAGASNCNWAAEAGSLDNEELDEELEELDEEELAELDEAGGLDDGGSERWRLLGGGDS